MVDDKINDEGWVTVVATGFDGRPAPQRRVAEPTIRRTKGRPAWRRPDRSGDLGGSTSQSSFPAARGRSLACGGAWVAPTHA